jgi:hypothetical protein
MLVMVPKDNLVRALPSRVAVVIGSSYGGEVSDSIFVLSALAGGVDGIASGRTDQAH